MLKSYQLPVCTEGLDAEKILSTTKHDKKMDAGKIKFVLLSRIGEAYVTKDVTDDEILDAVRYILEDGKDE